MVLLYGRARRLTAKNGGFRPGQSAKKDYMLDAGEVFALLESTTVDGAQRAFRPCVR
jgi:hypothetical protein